jgi:HAD superfamily hydrolase (TIGR01509 family)
VDRAAPDRSRATQATQDAALAALTSLVPAGRAPGPIRAVIFDLDGVLVDTEIWWDEIRIEFAAALGRTWTESHRVAIMGSNTPQWRARMRRLLDLEMSEDEIEAAVIGRMLERYAAEGAPAIDGAVEVVRGLYGRYLLAVASSAPPHVIEAALTGLGVRNLVSAVASSDEVAAGKPDPAVFLLAASRLAVDPAECLVVEDTLNGVLAARAAGMRVALVPNASLPPAAGAQEAATYVVASLSRLSDVALAQVPAAAAPNSGGDRTAEPGAGS